MEVVNDFRKKVLSNINKVLDGKVALFNFLDENEASILEDICEREKIPYYKYGGIEDSSRNRYILSNYEVLDEDFKISVYEIKYNKRYYSIEHKHVLGTLMSLGIKREVVGDIVIDDNKNIYFACTNEISKFILTELEFINRAKVELEKVDHKIKNIIKYEEKEILVSSYRLDSIISGVYNISRSQSLEIIKEGLVYVNHINNMNVSHMVKIGDEISVRHYGKFTVDRFMNVTRSNRLKIVVLIRR